MDATFLNEFERYIYIDIECIITTVTEGHYYLLKFATSVRCKCQVLSFKCQGNDPNCFFFNFGIKASAIKNAILAIAF